MRWLDGVYEDTIEPPQRKPAGQIDNSLIPFCS